MYSLLLTICWTRVIHGANWREHEARSPLQQWQLLLHHRGFLLSKVLSARRLSSAAGQSLTSPQPWPGIQMYGHCAVTGGTAAALFLEQKVCELSIQPHTAVSLHQIEEHYRKWMGRSDAWLFSLTDDASIEWPFCFFSFSLLESLCPTSEDRAATLHNCEDIFHQIMFCSILDKKNMANEDEMLQVYLHSYGIIGLIIPELPSLVFTVWKIRVTTSCILFFSMLGRISVEGEEL